MNQKQKFLKQKDLLKNSQNLRRLALQCQSYGQSAENSISLDFVLSLQRTAEEESLILDQLFNKYHYELILEELIHCRIEYLAVIVSFLANLKEEYVDTSLFVSPLFKLFRVVQKYTTDYESSSKIENDILSITNTVTSVHHNEPFQKKSFHANQSTWTCSSTWYDVCFTSLGILLAKLILKSPESLKHVNVSFADCVQLCNSDSWQVQYTSLSILYAYLLLEHKQASIPIVSSSSMKKNTQGSSGKTTKPTLPTSQNKGKPQVSTPTTFN